MMREHTYDEPLFAQFYDFIVERVFYDLRELEVNFWKSCARFYGGPILEMGCGTGGILLPLAEMGFSVTGVDFSPHMLRILEQKLNTLPKTIRSRVRLLVGDMIEPPINRSDFSLIIFAAAQFLHLRTDEQRLTCLSNCRRLMASA